MQIQSGETGQQSPENRSASNHRNIHHGSNERSRSGGTHRHRSGQILEEGDQAMDRHSHLTRE